MGIADKRTEIESEFGITIRSTRGRSQNMVNRLVNDNDNDDNYNQ